MAYTINDSDAGQYDGYVVVGLESEEEIAQTHAERVAELDAILGIVDSREECSCGLGEAGDHYSFEPCGRHGLESGTYLCCCYCDGPCQCLKMTSKQLAYFEHVDPSSWY